MSRPERKPTRYDRAQWALDAHFRTMDEIEAAEDRAEQLRPAVAPAVERPVPPKLSRPTVSEVADRAARAVVGLVVGLAVGVPVVAALAYVAYLFVSVVFLGAGGGTAP